MDASRSASFHLNSGRTASSLQAYQPQGTRTFETGAAEPADIANRQDILDLVSTFYTRAFADELIGPIFTDVVHMDLVRHMPIMADFWQTVLFKAGLYHRNALKIHFDIHALEPLTLEHFNRWLQLWTNTVDGLFSGEKAEMAKVQAHLIAGSLHRRVTGRPASQYSTISMRPPEAASQEG
ncbi:group III truncated hemoglobin [Arthrobacter sp. A2-55]|uniref:group III truncated hemoglobin n=1 Tax=Arthrobacter sp. A2-55 TaxID=2897337 RepID=UPI0021CDAA91|nr:group III truncated hemoglobin [Arthrobacter sp. A2-55]MCU6482610.1 group III truncated hemoglobin [Arthrobacter sp. A2-55]